MITFECPRCRNNLSVPDDKKGLRGKCPNCNSIINVPMYSANTLIFDNEECTIKSNVLRKLYEETINLLEKEDLLLNHKIEPPEKDNQITFITLKTGKYNHRKQLIYLLLKESEIDIYSKCERIINHTIAFIVLRLAKQLPYCRFFIDEDNDDMLIANWSIANPANISPAFLRSVLVQLARGADAIEAALSDVDGY